MAGRRMVGVPNGMADAEIKQPSVERDATGDEPKGQRLGWSASHELAHIIHDGSLRNRAVASRDGRVEPRRREAYSLQYVDRLRGEPARLPRTPHAGLSQQRVRDCSRSVHE